MICIFVPNFYIGSLWISRYTIFITGSNAKMLSGEINTTLGGRFLIAEVYPYSFKEFLAVHQVSTNENDLLATDGRARVIRAFDEEETISDKHGTIEVMPVWKWILEDSIFANRILIN